MLCNRYYLVRIFQGDFRQVSLKSRPASFVCSINVIRVARRDLSLHPLGVGNFIRAN